MPTIRIKENEPFDVALRRFKRSCEKAGILSERQPTESEWLDIVDNMFNDATDEDIKEYEKHINLKAIIIK